MPQSRGEPTAHETPHPIDLAPAASGLCRLPAGSVEVAWDARTKSLQVGGSYEGPVDIVEPW